MGTTSSLFLPLFLCLSISFSLTDGAQLMLQNNCKKQVWPGILGGDGQQTPKNGGFLLLVGQEVVINVPQKWSGRVWGRTGCNFNSSGVGSCETGDCAGLLGCRGTGGVPPATVVEMSLGSNNTHLSYYDVSLVDGFNLPVSVKPWDRWTGCNMTSCRVNINRMCPSSLEVKKGGEVVACKSACQAMPSDRNCCTGSYANPRICKATHYTVLFKNICPKASTYAFDNSSSLNKCRASRFVITFCPRR